MKDIERDMMYALEEELHARVRDKWVFDKVSTSVMAETLKALALARIAHVVYRVLDDADRLKVDLPGVVTVEDV